MQIDKGAHFKKCDLQVHTLRDENWRGPFANLVTDRPVFAKALVENCRKRGLHAVAITDHHDLCLWPVVRDAAAAEVRPDGSPIPNEEKLIVFPGIELTLATPSCQALLIFDPDLSEIILGHVWGCATCDPNAANEREDNPNIGLTY